jgi:hypothetical protein
LSSQDEIITGPGGERLDRLVNATKLAP